MVLGVGTILLILIEFAVIKSCILILSILISSFDLLFLFCFLSKLSNSINSSQPDLSKNFLSTYQNLSFETLGLPTIGVNIF